VVLSASVSIELVMKVHSEQRKTQVIRFYPKYLRYVVASEDDAYSVTKVSSQSGIRNASVW
jgi:hypothetical protein